MKLAIYIRVSTQKQATKGESPHLQKKEGIERAKEENLKYEVYDDSGVSGTANDIEKRVQMKRLLSDMEAGQISHIWAQSEERISRGNNLVSAYILDKIQEYKVLVLTKGMTYDLTTAQHRYLFTSIIGAGGLSASMGAEKSKNMKRERIKRGYSAGGNNMAYGYKSVNKKMVIDENEAEIIKRIYNDVANGYSANSVARALDSEGVKTKRGGQWDNTHINQILKNEIYIGKRKWGNEVFRIDPIINEELQQKALKTLKKNKKGDKVLVKDAYPYNTLLKCEKCGKKMRGWARSRKNGQLGVYKCECSSISVPGLHNAMNQFFNQFHRELNPTGHELLSRLLKKQGGILDKEWNKYRNDDTVGEVLLQAIEQLKKKKRTLGRLHYDETISESEYESELASLDSHLMEAERKYDQSQMKMRDLGYSLADINKLNNSQLIEVLNNEVSIMTWYQVKKGRSVKGYIHIELNHNALLAFRSHYDFIIEYSRLDRIHISEGTRPIKYPYS